MKIPDTKLRMVKVTPGPEAGTGGGDDDEAAAEMAGAAPSTEAVDRGPQHQPPPPQVGTQCRGRPLCLHSQRGRVRGSGRLLAHQTRPGGPHSRPVQRDKVRVRGAMFPFILLIVRKYEEEQVERTEVDHLMGDFMSSDV